MQPDVYDVLAMVRFSRFTKKFIEKGVRPEKYRDRIYAKVTSKADYLAKKITKMSDEGKYIPLEMKDKYIVYQRMQANIEDLIWASDYPIRFFEYHHSN